MKVEQFLIGICILISSCEHPTKIKHESVQKFKNKNDKVPQEPCEFVSWGRLPVITHGYSGEEHELVIVETYIKNTHFDSIIDRFELKNDREIRDFQREARNFLLPNEIGSNVDLKIRIGTDTYLITEVTTGWIARYGNDFLFYECDILNFKMNGENQGGNIKLKNPKFKYPWDY